MSFRIGGRISIDEINRTSFAEAAREIGIGQRMALQRFDALEDKFEQALRQSAAELSDADYESTGSIMEKILETSGIHNL